MVTFRHKESDVSALTITNEDDSGALDQANNCNNNSRGLRNAIRMTIAEPDLGACSEESQKKVRTKDIIKIFVDGTKADFLQVTPEQLDRVRTMHHKMSNSAKFSFNYNTLLLVASILAGIGLVSNSITTIIASMLVSPIMG